MDAPEHPKSYIVETRDARSTQSNASIAVIGS
jgi:hypothetical protein